MEEIQENVEKNSSSTPDENKSPARKPLSAAAHRMFHPPRLERKHSSGDLHSRLKTRKILGVGETDNGDVHRSKISQLLGHNEHLFVKFPKGYWCWHLSMAIVFTLFGLNNLFFPDKGLAVNFSDEQHEHAPYFLPSRFYGCCSLTFAFLLWIFLGTSDKYVAKGLLAALAFCNILEATAMIIEHWDDLWRWLVGLSVVIRILAVAPSVFFYRGIGQGAQRMRKSNSFNNLRDCANAPLSSPTFKKN